MLSHYTPPENATHAMLRDARRDGLSGLVSNGQAVNVTLFLPLEAKKVEVPQFEMESRAGR